MARRKNPTETIDETPVATSETEESAAVEASEHFTEGWLAQSWTLAAPGEVEAEKPSDIKSESAEIDVPDSVLEILKIFPNYPALLVTPDGGVFTPECKLAAAKAAILYKNPFYNT